MIEHVNTTEKVENKVLPQHRLAILAFIILLFGISASLAWIQFHQNPPAVAVVEPPAFKQPETLNGLLALSPAELEHCDIARMNLLCAEALPGTENLNVDAQARQRLARPVMLVHEQSPMNLNIPADPNPIQQPPRNSFQSP